MDYIIVGQGIAGTLLAHFLLQENKNVMVIDDQHHQSSSMVAAGLINPITGRNYVKTWRIEELIPFALKTYQALEKELGISIIETKNIAMLFSSIKEQNDWDMRSGNADLVDYVADDFDKDFYANFMRAVEGGASFCQAGRIKMKELVLAYQNVLQNKGFYLQEKFDYQYLEIKNEGVAYKEIQAKKIIFAEGYQAIQNPYFNYLPFEPAKGDILIIKIPNYPAQKKIVKHGIFIIPLYDDIYWIGSTYNRNYTSFEPLETEKADLLKQLEWALALPFEVLEHLAAIRPTVRDRRPFIGQHPTFKNLYLFNGMGAKGSYLTPLFAAELVEHLEHEKPLDKEIDIQRYFKYFGTAK